MKGMGGDIVKRSRRVDTVKGVGGDIVNRSRVEVKGIGEAIVKSREVDLV